MTVSPVHVSIIAVLVLLGVGLFGMMTLRNFVRIIIALQIAGKGVIIALVIGGIVSEQVNLAQSLAATFLVADTVVAVIGLALAVQIHRCYGTLDLKALLALHDQPPEAP